MIGSLLAKNVFWMFLGNVLYAFFLWLQLLLVAKNYDSWTLGTYTIALAISAPVFMFVGFQIRTIQVTDVSRKWAFEDFLRFRIISGISGFLITLLLALCFVGNERTTLIVIVIIALMKSLEGVSEIYNGQHQASENMKYIAISLAIKGSGATLGIFLGSYFFDSLIFGLLLALAFNVLSFFLVDSRNIGRKIDFRIIFSSFIKNRKNIEMLRVSLPLGLVVLIISANTNLPKYFVDSYLGRADQGIYSTLAYFIVIGSFVVSAVGQAFVPRLSKSYAAYDFRRFRKLSGAFTVLSVFLGVVGVVISYFFGDFILRTFIGPEFTAYNDILLLVMIGALLSFLCSSYGYALTAMREFKMQPWVNFFSLLIGGGASYFLIVRFGMAGACYGVMLVFVTQIIGLKFLIERKIKISRSGCC